MAYRVNRDGSAAKVSRSSTTTGPVKSRFARERERQRAAELAGSPNSNATAEHRLDSGNGLIGNIIERPSSDTSTPPTSQSITGFPAAERNLDAVQANSNTSISYDALAGDTDAWLSSLSEDQILKEQEELKSSMDDRTLQLFLRRGQKDAIKNEKHADPPSQYLLCKPGLLQLTLN